MRVLIVDDEEGLRITLAANLELEGFEVTEAESGTRAVELAREREFDLVLSDMRMPLMNGLELLRALKTIQPQIPVVLMTGFEKEETIGDALAEGVFTVLTKPCTVEKVVQTLQRAFRRNVVLIVDGTHGGAESTVEALLHAGVRARAVFGEGDALAAIEDRSIDVCVVDLVMPAMSGLEFVQHLRRSRPEIAVIAVIGYPVPEMMKKVATVGAYACMKKPFVARELVQVIAQARGR
jgi:DNA-binding NtrC family response regulator